MSLGSKQFRKVISPPALRGFKRVATARMDLFLRLKPLMFEEISS